MTLYRLVCEGKPGGDGAGDAPNGYLVHVPANSPAEAARKARTMGHTVRTVFARDQTTAIDRLRRWLAGVTPAATCSRCGYNFDGLVISDGRVRCPECGTAMRLYSRAERVTVEPQAPWR